jgi:hypothetical protein
MQSKSPCIWELLVNMEVATDLILQIDETYTFPPPHIMIVGGKIKPKPDVQCKRAQHVAMVGASAVHAVAAPTVFRLALASRDKVEMQWAVMTALTIDAKLREVTAAASPPMAAALVRDLPARFERCVLGTTDGAPALTMHEAVFDFAGKIEMLYSTISNDAAPK